MNARVITVAISKGGVGKTATVTNMAVGLVSLGYKVAAIDMDGQGHLAISFGINKHGLKKTIFDVLIGSATMKDIKKESYDVDLYLSDRSLNDLPETILAPENKGLFPNTHILLKKAIDQIRDKYDYILIDTPPSIDILNINALVASTDVIIPILPEGLAVDGVYSIISVIRKMQKQGVDLKILGVLATMVQTCTLHNVMLQDLRKTFANTDVKIFDTVIKRAVKHGMAQTNGTPDIVKSPEYLDFIKEALML